ncbi:2Fe-2S iron-sulfur cluster binding domain-containing protein [Candidatus Obscuribacterales bacterium]|nr:2Fe-2S iron-sulfur cluster binding domain-containing protein [Candidatus Obscuribacterales bacterium]MBX3150972.1 2Fe-2S iron-sulfur cluster binding domain-containing protein [Candidatus Obscuribacterales bacterium]
MAQTSTMSITLNVNGSDYPLQIEPRVSLLDALREFIGLTGTKKGCNQGACGACTVLVDGNRINSCLTLAAQYQGVSIQTVEGLAHGGTDSSPSEELHPLQSAFVKHDGFQCGYCTPGQLCSALGMLAEYKNGVPSAVCETVCNQPKLTNEEIRERMSGNLCRCGAYNGIVAAIEEYAGKDFMDNKPATREGAR